MTTKVVMPSLGLTMEEGRIVEWLKSEGDEITEGKPLLVIESEKAAIEIDAPAGGILREIIIGVDVTVPVGELIAVITDDLHEEIKLPSDIPEEKKEAKKTEKKGSGPPAGAKTAAVAVVASPVAKKIAKENGIELAGIKGTGPRGRITKEDVEQSMKNTVTKTPLSGIRKVIANRMSESAHSTAAVTLTCRADAGELVQVRESLKESLQPDLGFSPSYNDMLCIIVRNALKECPELNSHYIDDNIVQLDHIDIGIAVDTEAGLLVPVIKNVDKMRFQNISKRLHDLVAKAKAGNLLPNEMDGGTFTITNLGMFGIEVFTPIINTPQCAILGVGVIREAVIVNEGKMSIGKEISLSMSFDHRVVDGAPAAKFLQIVKQGIEYPRLEYFS